MIDLTQHQGVLAAVDDDSDVSIHADRRKIRVLGLRQLVELQPGMCRIHLEVKSRGLSGLLLIPCQFGETVGEGVGNSEVHGDAVASG